MGGGDTPTDSSCSGTAATRTLTVGLGLAFAALQMVLIHQSRGTGVGQWELNIVTAYNSLTGELTLLNPLDYTYTDSGASQAQVLLVRQYSKVTTTSQIVVKEWAGDPVGGIFAIVCNGPVTISHGITAVAKGYAGGAGNNNSGSFGDSGEGSAGASLPNSSAANGSGGGGGRAGGGGTSPSGGGNAAAGGGPAGGGQVGDPALIGMLFGGGGGGYGRDNEDSTGSDGGGIVLIFARSIVVETNNIDVGSLTTNLADAGGEPTGSAGTGAAGCIFLKGVSITIGTNLLQAVAAASGGGTKAGGQGANGRIRIEACSISGDANPVASESEGGFSFCTTGGFIY